MLMTVQSAQSSVLGKDFLYYYITVFSSVFIGKIAKVGIEIIQS